MEFSEKLAALRTREGLTQEQLAARLYVSRTAVSKWESGRGMPSIDSLVSIARAFDVTLDDLLSASAAIDIARHDAAERRRRGIALTSAATSLAALLGLLLPLYRHAAGGAFYAVPLYQSESALVPLFAAVQAALAASGAAAIASMAAGRPKAGAAANAAGDVLCLACALMFALSSQPYPAALYIAALVAKAALRAQDAKARRS